MKIPAQYLPLMPYLILKDANAFLAFAKHVFGAEEQLLAPADNGMIMHGELRIYEAVVMFAEASANWKKKTAGMYLYVDDVAEVYEKALSKKAKSLMPPERKDYGFTAGFEDPFGNHWWIVEPEKE